MSYLTLQKQSGDIEFSHHLLSLGCLAPVALDKYLEENPNIEAINLCLNNDQWGIAAANNIKKEYQSKYKINIEHPKLKDFNEDLIDSINYRNKSREIKVAEEEYEIEV
jgi:hypothetical protein